MLIKVYLHEQIANALLYISNGAIDTLANKIVDAGIAGLFAMETCPPCPKGGIVKKYYIDITNEEFLQLRETVGIRSSKVSLRRMLYWFVDEEAWELLDIKPEGKYIRQETFKFITRATRIADELYNLHKELPEKHKKKLLPIMKLMTEVLNDIRE